MKRISNDEKIRKNWLKRRILIIQFLVLGVIFMCISLPIIQKRSAEEKQRDDSSKVLNEVCQTLDDNRNIIINSENEFNALNQTNLDVVVELLKVKGVLNETYAYESNDLNHVAELQKLFAEINNQMGSFGLALIDTTGKIIISNDEEMIGNRLDELMGSDSFYAITNNNGTYKVENGQVIYTPLIKDGYYSYSKYLGEDSNARYYLMITQNSVILDKSTLSSKQVESVVSSISVGDNGFIFAVDKENSKFSYYNDGVNNLSGKNIYDFGVSDDVLNNDFSGYQTINGIKYFCVSKEYNDTDLGDYIFFTAVVSKTELVNKNINSMITSCLAFVLVTLTIMGYGFILRKDYVEHYIYLENKIFREIESDAEETGKILTHDEINERVYINLNEVIENNQDSKLKRVNVGTRDLRGRQHYMVKYIFSKMFPTMVMGLLIIFLITFFSQTLISLDSVTKSSQKRVSDISKIINENEVKRQQIQEYLDNQYLSKNKVLSYLLEEDTTVLQFDVDDENVQRHYMYDENGNKQYLHYNDNDKDYIYASANNKRLQALCDDNNIDSIYIFNDDGNVIATNTGNWNFRLSTTDEEAQSYPFIEVLNGEKEYYIQESMISEKEEKYEQFIGYKYHYYTYIDSVTNKTCFASKNDYENYKKNNVGPEIVSHRSLIQIGIDQGNVNHLLDSTSIGYVLSNMHIYGANSFYLAIDKTDDHKIIYAPNDDIIGMNASEIGLGSEIFKLNSKYNGFEKVNGESYYLTVNEIGDYYIATAVPSTSMYDARNKIAFFTFLLSCIFIVMASTCFTMTSDKTDEEEICMQKGLPKKKSKKSTFILETPVGKRKTSSAASRYYKIAWENKTPEQKLSGIIFFYLTIASIFVLFSIIYGFAKNETTTILNYIFSNEWERGYNIFAVIESLLIVVMVLAMNKFISLIVKSFSKTLGARAETTGNLIMAMIKFVAVVAAIFYCLFLFGFNTASLLTSAGILSLVIGLGAQSLISDILAGIFIVFEGEFRVGDIVTIDSFRGQVLEIGLRTTKIIDTAKNIKIFNNRSISGVLNMTKEVSVAKITVNIEYKESLERVEAILKKELPLIKKRFSKVVDGPFYKGVQSLSSSSVEILIVAMCSEQDRQQMTRDLTREIYLIFNKNNINIPFPQLTISHFKENTVSATSDDVINAYEFNKEQKEKIEIQEKEEC